MPMRIPILWSEALLSSQKGSSSQVPQTGSITAEVSLTPRNMHDSYSEFVLPFGTSKELLEKYTNASGGIRTGKSDILRLLWPFIADMFW